MRKKVWVAAGDIVLVSLRDYQDEKGDIIVKYTADEARQLKADKELPENTVINETPVDGDAGDDGFEFAGDSEDESDDDEINVDDI
jgi:translation initiation factor 1A